MTTAFATHSETETEAARALQIVASMPAFAWSADPTGRFTYVSANTLAFLGSAPDDLNHSSDEDEFGWRRMVHPDDYDRVASRWRQCLQTGDHYDTVHRLRSAEGTYRWFRNSGRPVRDSRGAITAWYGTTIDIEEQKQVEATLRERERELSQLVDMVPSHLWRLTPDGEPVFFNKRMVDFIGLDVADTDRPGMTRLAVMIAACVHPDDAASFDSALNHCLAAGERFSMRYRLRRVDGVYRWMSSRAEPMRDRDGRIVHWYGLCHDIDDQVKAEEALRDRERELSQIVDMTPGHVWRLTARGEPSFINKRLSDFLGLDVAEYDRPGTSRLSGAILTSAHPEDAPAITEAISRSLATGEPFAMRWRVRRADGVYRWVDSRAEPLRDSAGVITHWHGVNVDIDDQVHAEEVLRESERSLRQLVETLPAMIDCAAPDGEPVYRSRQLREFLGYDLKELDGTGRSRLTGTMDASVHPDDLASVRERYARSLATGEPYARRHRLRRFDGEYRWVETRAAPMRNADGAIAQWNVICLDIDGEVRAQEALRLAQERLARASQAASLAELSASIAHEVNQPLAAIVTNSHACHRWLTAEPPNLERAKITAERIIRDANSTADVVSRIRALFRQSTDARSSVRPGSVIAEVRDLMAEEAARRRVRMDVAIEDGLPLIALDRIQIQQVLVNLIRNGIEAMESVGGDRVLDLRVRRADNAIRTEVADRGPGVAFPDRMFEAFFTTKANGMGMGLSICRSIIESHGGRLWAEKNEPDGARFVFTLPLEARAAL